MSSWEQAGSGVPGAGQPAGPVVAPSPEAIRAELRDLGDVARKVVGGMVVVMMREPGSLRDREWLLEHYTHLCSEALDLGDAELERLQEFVRGNRDAVLNASFGLFLRVAADVQGIGEDYTLGQSTALALTYFA